MLSREESRVTYGGGGSLVNALCVARRRGGGAQFLPRCLPIHAASSSCRNTFGFVKCREPYYYLAMSSVASTQLRVVSVARSRLAAAAAAVTFNSNSSGDLSGPKSRRPLHKHRLRCSVLFTVCRVGWCVVADLVCFILLCFVLSSHLFWRLSTSSVFYTFRCSVPHFFVCASLHHYSITRRTSRGYTGEGVKGPALGACFSSFLFFGFACYFFVARGVQLSLPLVIAEVEVCDCSRALQFFFVFCCCCSTYRNL